MNHVQDELTALLDGALAMPRRAEVEAHLAGCPGCRAERDRLAGALATLAALPSPPAPSPGFEQRLAARLARERRPGTLAWLASWRWRLALPATGLVAAAAAALLMVRAHARDELLAQHLDLLEDFEAVASVGDVESEEDVLVVAELDALDRPVRAP